MGNTWSRTILSFSPIINSNSNPLIILILTLSVLLLQPTENLITNKIVQPERGAKHWMQAEEIWV